MAFTTRMARTDALSAGVRRVCDAGAPDRRVTVTLALRPEVQLSEVLEHLGKVGATVLSEGPGLVVAKMDCKTVRTLGDDPAIAAVALPQRFEFKVGR